MSSIIDGLMDIGRQAAKRGVDRAILGKDAAKQVALAEEQDYYASLNGSGPTNRAEALHQAKRNIYTDPPVTLPGGMAMPSGPVLWLLLGLAGSLVLTFLLKRFK
jgi:hypothetical protein